MGGNFDHDFNVLQLQEFVLKDFAMALNKYLILIHFLHFIIKIEIVLMPLQVLI